MKLVKYRKLIGICINCFGCMKLEDPNFIGVYDCKWNKKEKWVQEMIDYEKENNSN